MRFKALPVTSLEDVTLDLEQLQSIFHALTWTAPNLLNSWGNVGGGAETAGFLKDPLGFVHLKGYIGGGANATPAFQLPAGYRPGADARYPAWQSAGGGQWAGVEVGANGTVTMFISAAALNVSVSGVTPFLAEN